MPTSNWKDATPMDILKTLNMCDFCSREVETCGAKKLHANKLFADQGKLAGSDSIVACDKYESPVEILKKKFH
jgi:hypothetical protein